jgi:hypothetical protein
MDTPMLKSLKEYLENTSREQIDKDWAEVKSLGLKGPTAKELINTFNMNKIKATVIEKQGSPLNIYINSGNYPYVIAEEMNQKGYDVSVKQYECNFTAEQLYNFIKNNSSVK